MHYSYNRVKSLDMIYTAEAVAAFLVLAITHDVISNYIMFFLLILLVILTPPRVKPVRRNLQMFFGFVFLISNMSLITNYTQLIQVSVAAYSLETGVLMDLFLSLLGAYVLDVWDKLPVERERDCILPLRRLQSRLFLVAAGMFCFVAFCSIYGNYLEQLPAGTVLEMMKNEAVVLFQVCHESVINRFLFYGMEEYGVLGGVVSVAFIILSAERIYANRRFLHHENFMLTMCSGFMGQWYVF